MRENLNCRVLAEGANGPTTPDADLVLEKRQDEIFLIPDILCNSGGVVVSYFEWVQDLQQLFWEEEEVTRREYQILDRAFDQMVTRAEGRQDSASHRRDGDRRGEGPRRQEHAGTLPVITGLDHIVVLLGDIEAGARAYEIAARARAVLAKPERRRRDRAVHARQHVARADGAGGSSSTAERIRKVIKIAGEGLASICFRVGDIAKMHRRLDRVALKPEPVAEVESRDSVSGATPALEAHPRGDRVDAGRADVLSRTGASERPRSAATAAAPVWGSITSWFRPRIPSAPRRSTARGSASTWRSTARTRTGAS